MGARGQNHAADLNATKATLLCRTVVLNSPAAAAGPSTGPLCCGGGGSRAQPCQDIQEVVKDPWDFVFTCDGGALLLCTVGNGSATGPYQRAGSRRRVRRGAPSARSAIGNLCSKTRAGNSGRTLANYL